MFNRFLSVDDADRAFNVFRKLAGHEIGQWAITGGFAAEIHLLRLGRQASIRALNDLDFIAGSFDCIPETLAADFLFRHIHPSAPHGKTMVQFVDRESALRIDVFRASGTTLNRKFPLRLPSGTIHVVSVEDLVARAARQALDLAEGVPVALKHATDFLRLVELADPALMEPAWQDHRKLKHPLAFVEARRLLQYLIPAHPELLITPLFSHDTGEVCPRCLATPAFRLADPKLIFALLGYC
jgi:hypothetical protein